MPEVAPIPLRDLTTLRVGAAPARMVDAHTRDELVAALRDVWETGDEPWFVLGGGSNLLAGDEPFPGTVIRILTSGFEEIPGARDGFVRLRVEAGQNWDELVAWTVSQGLAGIEAMSGIPGTAGAAPIQNVGAYGQEIVQTLVEVELIDEATGDVSTVPASELGLGPRTSVLKHHYGSVAPRSAVVLSLTIDLARVGHEARPVADARLRSALGLTPDQAVSGSWIRETVLAIRGSKGMVLNEPDHDTHSAGSFFNNPIVSEAVSRTLPAECPRWPMTPTVDAVSVIPLSQWDGYVPPPARTETQVKVSAAWLIENSGLPKGFSLPRSRASLSTKHTLALTNRGGATAGEVGELARFVQSRVAAEFGIVLMPEPVLVGVEL
ncbi:UDP-N-acetylmuramate dehydrogenase [Microbacterium paludicola]|uniref:UDP-N-acetylenolpyruvoylglucosamine reductase n=1 Tax=Microbacterium paludicola TaxID=300019 RepID=A0A4Y9FWY7_9MICO|nr:UDP-N-acetylmuramate dehydrogenase [Microbacterium paludicola]MBF0815922.1 UDP-N-acetylmuramate dehydrogenase [Microbacterium paludicola]TFU33393.1 UDP-N-acetylmuramate dehydrogenase [Microbacterium paludicola]